MFQLLATVGFVSVALRAAALCSQTLLLGGIVFSLTVIPPDGVQVVSRAIRRLIVGSAIALALALSLHTIISVLALMESASLRLGEIAGADFVLTAGLGIGACLVILLTAGIGGDSWPRNPAMLVPGVLVLFSSVLASHAASSMIHPLPRVVLTALHQGATAVWIGGLPYLWLTLKLASDPRTASRLARNFSRLAMISVGVLAGAGLGLGATYIGSLQALYGTAYGAMAIAKIALFACLLVLGKINHGIVCRLTGKDTVSLQTLRRLIEAEMGFGVIVILAAASMTSQPPALDLVVGRVTSAEILTRLKPSWPRLKTPDLHELAYFIARADATSAPSPADVSRTVPGDTLPTSRADQEWSEYNHHWAGFIVLLVGLMALAARIWDVPLTRAWPLLFLALAAFMFFRADPENWPLGPRGFWASFGDPEVLQHRLATLLIIVFAIFEWRVRTGRTTSQTAALVFPFVCIAGAGVLLTHSHSLGNVKEELLAEWNHLPLAVFGAVAGCSRWLELRLPVQERIRPFLSWVWPVCFILVGALLLNYREF